MGFVPLKAWAPFHDLGRVGQLRLTLHSRSPFLPCLLLQVGIVCHQVLYSEGQSPFPVWGWLWQSVVKPLYQLLWLYTNDLKMTGTNATIGYAHRYCSSGILDRARQGRLAHSRLTGNVGLVAGPPPYGLFMWLGLPHKMVAGIQG